MIVHVIVLSIIGCYVFALGEVMVLPKTISASTSNESGLCGNIDTAAYKTDEVGNILNDVNSYLNYLYGPPCRCGTRWLKVADLDMSRTNQTCPNGWNATNTSEVRGCSRSSTTCSSAYFPTDHLYSKVCGQVIAVQFGTTDGFYPGITRGIGIEGPYLDGVSITHGSPGARQHIWSFASTPAERGTQLSSQVCRCSNTATTWPHVLPSFVGNNYFCDSGNEQHTSYRFVYYSNDPLWDGTGCGSSSTCCEFNNPPWFCTSLDEATGDSIEVRICGDHEVEDEDTVVTRMELYVQ